MDAIYAAIGAVFVAWLAHFLAEDYKAFREGSSIAAMLAGELTSYQLAFVFGTDSFNELIELAEKGKIEKLPVINMPTDNGFNAITPKLGLLGPIICRDLFYVYQNIAAFRSSFAAACSQSKELGPTLTAALLKGGTEAMGRAADKYSTLIDRLDKRARARWGLAKALPFAVEHIKLLMNRRKARKLLS